MDTLDSLSDADNEKNTKDGSSPENAIPVGSVKEEYKRMLLEYPDFVFGVQGLMECNGRYYDVHTLSNSEGETKTVYFDISKFYGKA